MQPDILIDKLNQLKSENKKLTETLIFVSENYNTLQRHLIDLVQKYSGDELPNSRKRKFEADNTVNTFGHDGTKDCISEDDGSPKRPREIIRTNISSAFVRVDPSDASLVSSNLFHLTEEIEYNFSNSLHLYFLVTKCVLCNNFLLVAGSEGWLSLAKIWTKGY